MTSIVIANTKGGTGKTTTALNLATELSLSHKSVLLIDLDPQASLSKAVVGESELAECRGVEDLINNSHLDLADYITSTTLDNVSLIPCHAELGDVSLKLVMNASFYAIKDLIRKIANAFDFVLMDTQPSKNILMLNAFTASQYVLIPTNPGVYPLMDIVALEETIQHTAMNSNPDLQILGVVLTMVGRGTVYQQLAHEVRDYFKEKVFDTTISRLVKSEESALEGVGVSGLDATCKLATQYRRLTQELLERLENGG